MLDKTYRKLNKNQVFLQNKIFLPFPVFYIFVIAIKNAYNKKNYDITKKQR